MKDLKCNNCGYTYSKIHSILALQFLFRWNCPKCKAFLLENKFRDKPIYVDF